MVIERIDDEKIVMTFENKIDAFDIQSLIDYANYLESTACSQSKQEDIDTLADDVSRNWWTKVNGFDKSLSEEDFEITPLVSSLCGIIKLPQDFDYKTEYGSHLLQKYQ